MTRQAVTITARGLRKRYGEVRALDFGLDEVREARLVPVLDFKGRRFLPAAQEGAAAPGEDGGLKQ